MYISPPPLCSHFAVPTTLDKGIMCNDRYINFKKKLYGNILTINENYKSVEF